MTAIPVPLTETSHDPRTGDPVLTVAIAGPIEVDEAVRAARVAAGSVCNTSPADRAGWLEAIADAVLARADELAEVADRETGLGRVRLDGEVLRCAAQLRFYAAVARDGGFLDVVIDRATQAQPDLRRMRVPLGPVAVFGASNFPFAFGSLGHDTASALAAGCSVVIKAHPAHLATHQLLLQIATRALAAAGAPEGTLSAVTGFAAGTELVLHPALRAVAFTGSQQAGLALAGLSATRVVPIPVFAEMSTVNPVVVTSAAQARAATIGAGCATSFTM
ncbi:MAG: aldehyde dehydrogenase family protein, partial [Terracoccus sp.]